MLQESYCSNSLFSTKDHCEQSGECSGVSFCSDATFDNQEDCENTLNEIWFDVSNMAQAECEARSQTWSFYTWTDVGQDFYAIGTCSHCNL